MASCSSSVSLIAYQTPILQKHSLLHHKPSILSLAKSKSPISHFSIRNPNKTLLISSSLSTNSAGVITKSSELSTDSPVEPVLTGATKTITTLFAIAVTVSKLFAHKLTNFALNLNIQQNVISTAGPLFFATMSGRPARLHTPLTVVAAGMAKWLDIYSGVLLVRVLLSWFPNIPWDRQPLSAIRDLCDPYLNLFRNIIPPVFDTLDVSPLLAFAVLGFLAGVLKNSRMGY
ncbi:ylmG homolog protein 1-2, chloroplastic [Rutidosis leptorrhynchoides]|uniref:ylmG homolog protein 1-2, chloroplastic n=1 Tax=Rutidosis leptorrhynchoides TaxID=125765 RepID=UPI003A993A6E